MCLAIERNGVASKRLPDAARFDRLGLSVADSERVERFYREIVGLDRIEKHGDRTELGAGGRGLLVLHHDPDLPPRPASAAGLFHAAFRVPSRDALGAALSRIRREGTLDGASDHGFSEALYLTDPEGNGVEIYRDRGREEWPWTPDGGLRATTRPLDLSSLATRRSAERSVPPDTTLGHVHLEVTDVDRSLAFYRDALGFSLRIRPSARAAFLAANDYHHHIAFNTWQGRSTPLAGCGLRWLELALPAERDVNDVRERVSTGDVSVDPLADGFSIDDPDGIPIRCVLRG